MKELAAAIVKHLKSKGYELSTDPNDEVVIPLTKGQILRIPVELLNP